MAAGPAAYAADVLDRLNEGWRWVELGAGLPAGRVAAIVETTGGVSWARTATGVAYFDGYRWRPIRPPSSKPQMPDRIVPDTPDGVLLVAGGRLYRGDQRGFDPIPVRENDTELAVRSVTRLDGGDLLVLTSGRLVVAGPAGLRAFPTPALPAGDEWMDVRRAGDRLWLTSNGATFEWTGDAWQRRLDSRADLVVADGEGALLAGTTGGTGVWVFDGRRPPWRRPDAEPSWVYSMDVHRDGTAVVAYASGRVVFRADGVWRPLAHPPGPMTHPYLVDFRSDGSLWIDTSRGLMLFRAAAERWTSWSEPGDPLRNVVNAFHRRSDGTIWMGTNGGVLVRDPDGSTRVIDRIGEARLTVVTGVAEDASGDIWVASGSHLEGVLRWDGAAWRQFGAADGLLVRHVHAIERDRQGRLWFLGIADDETEDPGPYLFEGGRFRLWNGTARLPARRVYAFREDRRGAYWFGTDDGVCRWRDGRWSQWTTEDGLAVARVYAIETDYQDRVWFGHRSGRRAIGSIDPRDTVRYVAEGVSSVRGFAIGPDDALWVATGNGLLRHDGRSWCTLGSETGLEHVGLWPIVASDRAILVGTQGGGVYALDLDGAGHAPPLVEIETPVLGADRALFRWSVFPHDGELAGRDARTRYRFDGGPWSQWSTARETTAIGLAPGSRRFAIEARNLFGTRTSGAMIGFDVAPPLHRHPVLVGIAAAWAAITLAIVAIYWRRRRRDQEVLRERERHFRMLIENASDLITVVDEHGIVQYQSPSATRTIGRAPREIVGRPVLDLVRPWRPGRRGASARASLRSPAWSRVVRVRHADGTWRVLEAFGRRVRGSDGAAITIINSRDVTERLAAEEEVRSQSISERLLRQELDHRVRNNLSSLLALIDLGRASTNEVDVFARRIRDRTHAMALVHTLLSRRKWRAVDLAELIVAVLPPDARGRIMLEGPPQLVEASRCQALALVVNELMTNSLKHGALGVSGGTVEVRWRSIPDDPGAVELSWRESGGPTVAVKVEPGLGARLIRGLVQRELRGTIEERYERTGARHDLTFSAGAATSAESAPSGNGGSL